MLKFEFEHIQLWVHNIKFKYKVIDAVPSIFAILSVGFLLIEYNKGLVFNVYYLCKIGVIFTEV